MREISELSEEEAGWLKQLLILFPEGFGYNLERDPPVREFSAELVAEGRVERVEFSDGTNPWTGEPAAPQVAYRLAPEHAEEIRNQAEERRDAAQNN